MTNDFDELLSAYIDGETTPDETARVEADPELRAAAETMRALSGEIGRVPLPGAEVRSAHLAAALDAFGPPAGQAGADGGNPASDADVAPVASLEDRRQGLPEASRSRGLPSWLGAAAAAVVVVGGIGFAIQGFGGSDDAGETAADFVETEETESDEVDDGAADSPAASSAETLTRDGEAAGGDDLEAMADDEMPEQADAADTEESEVASDETSEDADEEASSTGEATSTTVEPGFSLEQIEDNRVPFDTVPTADEQAELASGELLPVEWSTCGSQLELDESLVIGFLPISVDGVNGEFVVFAEPDSDETRTLFVDGSCQAF